MNEEEIRALFGKNIKYLRKQQHLSQTQLAERANVALNFINDIENSKKWVSPATLSKLSIALNVHPYKFFIPVQSAPEEEKPSSATLLEQFGADILQQLSSIISQSIEQYT